MKAAQKYVKSTEKDWETLIRSPNGFHLSRNEHKNAQMNVHRDRIKIRENFLSPLNEDEYRLCIELNLFLRGTEPST